LWFIGIDHRVAAYRLDSVDPVRSVETALIQGDRRLIGVYGVGLDAPGVPDECGGYYRKKLGITPIKGTSDCYIRPGEREFNQSAREYARRHNTELLRRFQGTASPEVEKLCAAIKAVDGETAILDGKIAALQIPLRALADGALRKALGALKETEYLGIRGDPITQDQHLLPASELKAVTSLNLADTGITNVGLDQIRGYERLDTLF